MDIILTTTDRLKSAEHDNMLLRREVKRQQAIIDYVAIITDVEIPMEVEEDGQDAREI